MPNRRRTDLICAACLAVPIFFWIFGALFWFRVVNIMDRVLMKLFGPVVIYASMTVLPLAVLILGVRMWRQGRRRAGPAYAVSGAALFLAFAALIGIPLLGQAFAEKTPPNPTTPRPVEPQTGIPVFPGAEGFGTRTPAGRGGKVIAVTTLEDSGPGSLREALLDPEPRVVVFRVGGTIALRSHLLINHPFVTVAGQTAPGGGIALKGAGLVITSHDVLVQHLRIRPGNEGPVDADTNDAVAILGRHGKVDGAHHVVLDHLSCSWSEDETVSTWFGAHDITISWCIISEALNRSRHRKETHSAGLLVGDGSWHVSVHRCLLAHNDFRNPLISGGGTHDFVNNVVYDWGCLPAEVCGDLSNLFLNFVGNTYRRGPSTTSEAYPFLISPTEATPKLYVEGNTRYDEEPPRDNWRLVTVGWGNPVADEKYRAREAFKVHPVTAWPAKEAFEKVLTGAGATAPRRDAVDERIATEARTGKGRIIDSPAEVGGHPKLSGGTAPTDSDHDGMPDAWERERGLDPEEPADGRADADGDGYTNLEEYLHSLAR